MPEQPRPKRLGKPLDWSEESLDQLAEVRQPDIDDAVAFWNANCPPALRGLLDAEVMEEDG